MRARKVALLGIFFVCATVSLFLVVLHQSLDVYI